eukprot:CAMPEP_0196140440 /NCGR_PEP_ID=MMETSP0910-20130528/7346_1 /TAXON_ID=49265 /ORGANISM="Thalassiosira rotula, Strain GSO102" /LENGTH=577 /DNA_ID=CAMNT_0041401299 /DNA_START=214 /DNA_END=1944 /DNA_ORIENTATION=+
MRPLAIFSFFNIIGHDIVSADSSVIEFPSGVDYNEFTEGGQRQQERELAKLNHTRWDATYRDFTVNIGPTSDRDIVLQFVKTTGRDHREFLYAKGCKDDIDVEGVLTQTDAGNGTDGLVAPEGDEMLSLAYNFDTSKLAMSNIWILGDDNTTAKIEFCHVLQLIEPMSDSLEPFVVVEDQRNILIDLSLMADFDLTTSLMGSYGVRMTFLAMTTINNFSPSTPEEVAKAKEAIIESISKHAEEELKAGQGMFNTTIISFEANATEKETQVTTELVIDEGCRNTAACEDLMNITSMYDDVTDHLRHKFENGDFVATLNALYVFRRHLLSKLSSFQDPSPSSPHPLHRMVEFDSQNETLTEDLITVEAVFSDPVMEMIAPKLDIRYISSEVSLQSYVKTCKCDGAESFKCDSSVLPPNSMLTVCIWSKSRDVEVRYLDTLVLNQGDSSFDVVKTQKVEYDSISSMEYVDSKNGVVVKTRVPSNLFKFETGGVIIISGEIQMKLYGEERRRRQLIALTSDVNFDEESPFELQVTLEGEVDSTEEVTPLNGMGDSANPATVASQSIALMGVFGSLIYSLYW